MPLNEIPPDTQETQATYGQKDWDRTGTWIKTQRLLTATH